MYSKKKSNLNQLLLFHLETWMACWEANFEFVHLKMLVDRTSLSANQRTDNLGMFVFITISTWELIFSNRALHRQQFYFMMGNYGFILFQQFNNFMENSILYGKTHNSIVPQIELNVEWQQNTQASVSHTELHKLM